MMPLRPGTPGLPHKSLALPALLAISGILASAASAAEPSPVVTPEDKAAPAIAAPYAAPKVDLPYKLLTKPSADNYSASRPALAIEAAPAAAPALAPVAAPAPAAPPAKSEPATQLPATATTTGPSPAAPVEAQSATPAPVTPPVKTEAAIAAPKKPAPPEITLNIDIDLTRQKMTLTEYGKVVGSWPVSSGAEGHRSPTGTFRPVWSSKMWYSKQYDNAPMPHAVFFNGGVAMHATQSVGRLGTPASHGCIRQSPANAEKTYKLVAKHGNSHVKIVVHGKPKDDEPRVARRDRDRNRDTATAAAGFAPRYAAARDVREARPQGTRRVIIVDGYGNRRIAEIPANDPRLAAYYSNRNYYGGTYGGYAGSFGNRW